MPILLKRDAIVVTACSLLLMLAACTRNTIELGQVPENNYTNLSYIDTINVNLSTVLTDSFPTGAASVFLVGRYKDPYLGTISAKPFFQLDKPATIPDINTTAIYDSAALVVRPNDYYYGDTSLSQTLYVYELAQSILTTYAGTEYNTTDVAVKPTPIGTKTLRIRPVADDSIFIRLNDVKGRELFTKLQQRSTDVSSTDNFLQYFKGLSLSVGPSDVTAIYGLTGGAGNIVLRVFYHTNTPYDESHQVDFPALSNELSFNQVLADRSNTGIVAGNSGVTELLSSQTGNNAFSQPGTGLNMKLSFPSLKSVLQLGTYVKLLRADLIVRPAYLSYDISKYVLPDKLGLAATDGSNIMGSNLTDSTGNILYATPVIDLIYGENTYYRFNVTSYINELLGTSGNDNGLYIVQPTGTQGASVTRMVSRTTGHSNFITQLQLSLLIIK